MSDKQPGHHQLNLPMDRAPHWPVKAVGIGECITQQYSSPEKAAKGLGLDLEEVYVALSNRRWGGKTVWSNSCKVTGNCPVPHRDPRILEIMPHMLEPTSFCSHDGCVGYFRLEWVEKPFSSCLSDLSLCSEPDTIG